MTTFKYGQDTFLIDDHGHCECQQVLNVNNQTELKLHFSSGEHERNLAANQQEEKVKETPEAKRDTPPGEDTANSRYNHEAKEESLVRIKGTTVVYDHERDEYEIDLSNVHLVWLDSRCNKIRIKIKADQIQSRDTHSPLQTEAAVPDDNALVRERDRDEDIDAMDMDDEVDRDEDLDSNETQPAQPSASEDDATEDEDETQQQEPRDPDPEQQLQTEQQSMPTHDLPAPTLALTLVPQPPSPPQADEDDDSHHTDNNEPENQAKAVSTPLAAGEVKPAEEPSGSANDEALTAPLAAATEITESEVSATQATPSGSADEPDEDKTDADEKESPAAAAEEQPQNEEQAEEEEEEPEEVLDVDKAMQEMIAKSAEQKQQQQQQQQAPQSHSDEMEDLNDGKPLKRTKSRRISSGLSSDTASASASPSKDASARSKLDWKVAFRPHCIKKEWIALMPSSNDSTTEHFSCHSPVHDCKSVARLLFVLNQYCLFMRYKLSLSVHGGLRHFHHHDYPKTMSEWLNLLMHYSKQRLLNDYFHCKRYHMNRNQGGSCGLSRVFVDHFKQHLRGNQCVSCSADQAVCLQWERNNRSREVYGRMSSEQRKQLFFVTADCSVKENSFSEMNEINLQQFLDMLHSTVIHKSISDGRKFMNTIHSFDQHESGSARSSSSQALNLNDDHSATETTETDADDDRNGNNEEDDVKSDEFVDAPNYSFGQIYDYWDKQKANFVASKYRTLKDELLKNTLHKLDKNDYNLLWYKANDFLNCNEGKYMLSKRVIERSKFNKLGKEIMLDHVMALMIYCNYGEITSKLKNACRKLKKRERLETSKSRHSEIANWCRLLIEAVYCFGDALSAYDEQYLYVNLNCKLLLNVLQVQFNAPTSTTMKYVVAKMYNNELARNRGIVLKLAALSHGSSKDLNAFLNMSAFSDFPNEFECLVYGHRFEVLDIMVDAQSIAESLDVLRLYYQIIRGRWYTQNKQQFKKKNQRQIIKLIQTMMKNCDTATAKATAGDDDDDDDDEKGDDTTIQKYVQLTFESMTKHLLRNVIWINRNGMEQLLPELKQLFFDQFLDHLRKHYNIKTQESQTLVLQFSIDELINSRKESPVTSTHCRHPVNIINAKNIADLKLSFRCYKKYDAHKNEQVLKGEFEVQPFSARIAQIRMSGGMWCPQLAFEKWDFCTLTHQKMHKGSSLFSLNELEKLKKNSVHGSDTQLIVKICFQVKDIIPAKHM